MSSVILVSLVVGLLSGLAGGYAVSKWTKPSQADLIAAFYQTETAVMVSPHHLRKEFSKSSRDFILVDVRGQEEYEKEHIIEAVNVPAYKDPNTSAYGDVERIVTAFQELYDQDPERDIVVYCYSIPCMTGRKIGKMLADHGLYVKELGVGWNEWRHFWTLWNHEHEWGQTKVEDYVASGKEPGVFAGKSDSEVCDVEGELGC